MKKKYLICILIILVVSILSPVVNIHAQSSDYVTEGRSRIPIPKTYILKKVINNIDVPEESSKYFNSPEGLFINEQGYLFVVDTGNNRVVKLDREGNFIAEFTGQKDSMLKSPKGIFVDKNGNMYIADTGNKRIAHLSANGRYVEEFRKPESELLGDNFTFEPSKVSIGNAGNLYILKGETILTVDAYNRFRGYLGQTNIGFSLKEVLAKLFASDEQKRFIVKRLAANYINFTVGPDGMIYATTLDNKEGEIKKLNSIGKNIYRKYTTVDSKLKVDILEKLFSYTYITKPFHFGERVDENNKSVYPRFSDIAVDKNGIISVIAENLCKVYQYDQEGNLLTVFGGKADKKGKFLFPNSICVDEDGNLYILDKTLNNIQVFEKTKFMSYIHDAVNYYADGDYTNAHIMWQNVLDIDANYELAHRSIAKSYIKQEKWHDAMRASLNGDDRILYSEAFNNYRHQIFRDNFAVVMLCIILIFITLILLIRKANTLAIDALDKFREGSPDKMKTRNILKLALATPIHPMETNWFIKENREKMNYLPSFIILFLVVAMRIIYIFTTHYPLMDVEPRNASIWLECVRFILPIITWVFAITYITSITSGESKRGEVFVATSFCMIPHILVTIPLVLLSRIISITEAGLYGFIINLTWIVIAILIFISVKELNDYSIGKTILVCFIGVLTMILIWAVAILIALLIIQLGQFIFGIIREIGMTLT